MPSTSTGSLLKEQQSGSTSGFIWGFGLLRPGFIHLFRSVSLVLSI
jgi:hypothetical protein